jgi:uncharacterized glyoxalase superfamily protein PhnB
MRMLEPDGKIGQAELRIGDSLIMLLDEYPELGVRSPAQPQDSRRHVGDDQRLRRGCR